MAPAPNLVELIVVAPRRRGSTSHAPASAMHIRLPIWRGRQTRRAQAAFHAPSVHDSILFLWKASGTGLETKLDTDSDEPEG